MPKSDSDKKPRPKASQDPGRCCCGPRPHVWIDARSTAVYVENQILESRHFQVRADVANSINQPQPDVASDGSADSELDQSIAKNQGKVYRTDCYTVHWKADGDCRPLQVTLGISGETEYSAGCLPEEGEVTLSRAYMLEPPDYRSPGPGFLTATLAVTDCCSQTNSCTNTVPRP